jgi:hypothetical protein
MSEPNEEPKDKPGLKDGMATPVFEVMIDRIVLVTDRQEYTRGQLVDLSHLPWASIKALIQRGIYRTASGEPANVPAKTYPPCKHC